MADLEKEPIYFCSSSVYGWLFHIAYTACGCSAGPCTRRRNLGFQFRQWCRRHAVLRCAGADYPAGGQECCRRFSYNRRKWRLHGEIRIDGMDIYRKSVPGGDRLEDESRHGQNWGVFGNYVQVYRHSSAYRGDPALQELAYGYVKRHDPNRRQERSGVSPFGQLSPNFKPFELREHLLYLQFQAVFDDESV